MHLELPLKLSQKWVNASIVNITITSLKTGEIKSARLFGLYSCYKFILEVGFWTEGSFKLGCTLSSIVPFSICPSSSFHEIGSLGFSKNLHSVRWPYLDVRNRGGLLEKKLPQKWGKWVKNLAFWIYWNFWSLILSKFCQ